MEAGERNPNPDGLTLVRAYVLACTLVLPQIVAAAAPAPQPCEAETRALMTMKSSWSEIYRAAVALPARCFDGYFAEGISDTIVRKMGQDWAGFTAALAAHAADERFMALVLRSINATLDPKDIKLAGQRATSECPDTLKIQCGAILQKAAEALRE